MSKRLGNKTVSKTTINGKVTPPDNFTRSVIAVLFKKLDSAAVEWDKRPAALILTDNVKF